MMDITRNQFFYAGLVLLLLGIQFRMVESFDLNGELTRLVNERSGKPVAAVGDVAQTLTQSEKPLLKARNIRPPARPPRRENRENPRETSRQPARHGRRRSMLSHWPVLVAVGG